MAPVTPYPRAVAARFLTLDDVADELAISRSQAYALVRNGTLPAMKVGGRGQWRVERTRLEQWIEQSHTDTSRFVQEHPYSGQSEDEPDA
jgi:excisionase family DNA binding protein